jgi:histidine triad (HIT) family protein
VSRKRTSIGLRTYEHDCFREIAHPTSTRAPERSEPEHLTGPIATSSCRGAASRGQRSAFHTRRKLHARRNGPFAFLDIMPRAPGHTLVILKSPAREVLDIGRMISPILPRSRRRSPRAMTVFEADGVTVQQFNETAGGQVVFHLHVHVLPRREGVPLKPPASEKENPGVLAEQAKRLAAALAR